MAPSYYIHTNKFDQFQPGHLFTQEWNPENPRKRRRGENEGGSDDQDDDSGGGGGPAKMFCLEALQSEEEIEAYIHSSENAPFQDDGPPSIIQDDGPPGGQAAASPRKRPASGSGHESDSSSSSSDSDSSEDNFRAARTSPKRRKTMDLSAVFEGSFSDEEEMVTAQSFPEPTDFDNEADPNFVIHYLSTSEPDDMHTAQSFNQSSSSSISIFDKSVGHTPENVRVLSVTPIQQDFQPQSQSTPIMQRSHLASSLHLVLEDDTTMTDNDSFAIEVSGNPLCPDQSTIRFVNMNADGKKTLCWAITMMGLQIHGFRKTKRKVERTLRNGKEVFPTLDKNSFPDFIIHLASLEGHYIVQKTDLVVKAFLHYFYKDNPSLARNFALAQNEPEDWLGSYLRDSNDTRYNFMQIQISEWQARFPCGCSEGNKYKKVGTSDQFAAFVTSRLPNSHQSLSDAIEESKEQCATVTCKNKIAGDEKNPILCECTFKVFTKTEFESAPEILFVKLDRGSMVSGGGGPVFLRKNQHVLDEEIYITTSSYDRFYYTLIGGALHVNDRGYADNGHYQMIARDETTGYAYEYNDSAEIVPSGRLGQASMYMYMRVQEYQESILEPPARRIDEPMEIDNQSVLAENLDLEAQNIILHNKMQALSLQKKKQDLSFYQDIKYFVFWKESLNLDWFMIPINAIFMCLKGGYQPIPHPPQQRVNWGLADYFKEMYHVQPADVIDPSPVLSKLAIVLHKPALADNTSLNLLTFFDCNIINIIERCFPTLSIIPKIDQTEVLGTCKNKGCKAPKSSPIKELQNKLCPYPLVIPDNLPKHLIRGEKVSIQNLININAVRVEEKAICHSCGKPTTTKTSKKYLLEQSSCIIFSIIRSPPPKKSTKSKKTPPAPKQIGLEVDHVVKVPSDVDEHYEYELVGGIRDLGDNNLALTFKKGNTFCTLLKRDQITGEGSEVEYAKLCKATTFFYKKAKKTRNFVEDMDL